MTTMTDKSDQGKITIRGLDPALYKLARIEALREGRTVAQWIGDSIRESLRRRGVPAGS